MWHSLTWERGNATISPRRTTLETPKNEEQKFEDQVAVVRMAKWYPAFEQDICKAKVSPLQTFLSRYLNACNHVANRISDKGVHLAVGRVVAAWEAADKDRNLISGLILLTKHCVCRHIALARASTRKRGLALVEILLITGDNFPDNVPGQSVFDDNPVDTSSLFSVPWCTVSSGSMLRSMALLRSCGRII